MSWLSNAVKAVKKAVVDTGHVVGKVASNPIVTGAAGLFGGPLAGAAVGGLGKLIAPGGNLGRAAGGAATGALAGAIRPLASRIGGFGGGSLSSILHGGRTSTMGADQMGDFPHAEDGFGFGGGGGGLGGFLSGAVKGIGGLLGGGGGGLGGLGNLAVGGLAGYQAINAANASKRAGQLQDKALGLAEQRWTDAAPLRTAGQAALLNPVRPELSSIYTDPTNPFAATPRVVRLPAR